MRIPLHLATGRKQTGSLQIRLAWRFQPRAGILPSCSKTPRNHTPRNHTHPLIPPHTPPPPSCYLSAYFLVLSSFAPHHLHPRQPASQPALCQKRIHEPSIRITSPYMSGAPGPSIWSIKPKKKPLAPPSNATGSSSSSARYNNNNNNKRPHAAIKDEDEDKDLQELFDSGNGEHSHQIAKLLDKRTKRNNPPPKNEPG